MANYDESEYFTDSQEEIAEREAQEALRRMVRICIIGETNENSNRKF